MPGLTLVDLLNEDEDRVVIVAEQRDELIKMVHALLLQFTGKRPRHTSFLYHPAGSLDASTFDFGPRDEFVTDAYDYILVVDGELRWKTFRLRHKIRKAIKLLAAGILKCDPERIAVRYRLHISSFG